MEQEDPRRLRGTALDWAVNHIEEGTDAPNPPRFSRDWSVAGPVIEREGIELSVTDGGWWAEVGSGGRYGSAAGSTPLEAAMRAYVVSRVGRKVLVPSSLLSVPP